MKYLNIDHWNRKDHYKFFSSFTEPFFGVTVTVDVTRLYEKAKDTNTSLYIQYLHKSLVAANGVEAFRYRIEEDQRIVIYDTVGASATVPRADSTFGFSYMPYHHSYNQFSKIASDEMRRVKQSTGLDINVAPPNVIFYSSLPWLDFTSVSHARNFAYPSSNPMITFGKINITNGRRSMPMSIHVHHGLMDGIHVAEYVENYQTLINI